MHCVRTGKSYQDCYINVFVIEYSYIIELAKTLQGHILVVSISLLTMAAKTSMT